MLYPTGLLSELPLFGELGFLLRPAGHACFAEFARAEHAAKRPCAVCCLHKVLYNWNGVRFAYKERFMLNPEYMFGGGYLNLGASPA